MFRNPNYEWMEDYDQYQEPFFGYLYWIYMYHKIFLQGTDEDRYKMEELYDKYQSHAPFPFNIITGIFEFGEVYQKVVRTMVYDTVMEHYKDESARRDEAEAIIQKKKFDESTRRLEIVTYGYSHIEADEQAKMDANRLRAERTEEQTKYDRDPATGEAIHYGCGTYLKNNVRILKRDDLELVDPNGRDVGIHGILFDMYKGSFLAAVYVDGEYDRNGKQIVHQAWSNVYANTGTIGMMIDGIESRYRLFIDEMKQNVCTWCDYKLYSNRYNFTNVQLK
ncbi:hypothetical protein [Anaerovibrio sp. RM50]|uniref:hypothetical protein n=1 Tax=Anaerovibrio sp. RM50 TaxID=1200557 RepID=UPI000481FBB2|nr:hypothetical protein [Anaerovibrio sp. RM50]